MIFTKYIAIIVGAAVIWVASCLLLRKDKGGSKKRELMPSFLAVR